MGKNSEYYLAMQEEIVPDIDEYNHWLTTAEEEDESNN